MDPASKKMPQASKAEAVKAEGLLQDSALAELDQVHPSYQWLIYVLNRKLPWIVGLAKYFSVKRLKLHRELWAIRYVHSKFERHPSIFYHATRALKLAILRLFRPKKGSASELFDQQIFGQAWIASRVQIYNNP